MSGMNEEDGGGPPRRPGNAFLLAQIGAHAAARFAQRIAEIDLTPGQAGLLRLITWQPGQSQRALARRLGTPPSRLVHLVDELERRGLIERRQNPADRRNHALYLTSDGSAFMGRLGRIGAAHEDEISGALSAAEKRQLNDLLTRMAAQQGLTVGVHPGYRDPADGERKGDGDGQTEIVGP